MTASLSRLLRAEAALLAVGLAVWLCGAGPPAWLVVAVLIAPDLSFAGYLGGPLAGAAAYNAAHSLLGPLALGLLGWAMGGEAPVQVAAVWALHCAADRALGYGLKRSTGFADTHLGRIGRGG